MREIHGTQSLKNDDVYLQTFEAQLAELGRERAAVDVDVGPERRSPRYHETCLALERRWVLLKIPRCDIDGLGEKQ